MNSGKLKIFHEGKGSLFLKKDYASHLSSLDDSPIGDSLEFFFSSRVIIFQEGNNVSHLPLLGGGDS